MKECIVTICVSLVVVLLIGITTALAGWRLSQQFRGAAEEIEKLVKEEAWDEATAFYERLNRDWESHSPVVEFFVQHADTDSVNIAIKALRASLEERERLHALLYLAELDESFGHIYHRDAFTLSNII